MRYTDQAIDIFSPRKTPSYIDAIRLPLCTAHSHGINIHDLFALLAPRGCFLLEVEAVTISFGG